MPLLTLTSREVSEYLTEVFPELFPRENAAFSVVDIQENSATLGFTADATHLRPGGTVSGPAMMTLADVTMYAAVLAHKGRVALAVTSNLNINFLRKPTTGRLLAAAKILKPGKTLVVGDVLIYSEAEPDRLLAQASVTYAMPQKGEVL